ncbi:MAG: M48 family metallopeptidase [Verrucomicrobiales bacterium]|nr:M48 family metallopeptidase [Verrucomicrobiales bacterium]
MTAQHVATAVAGLILLRWAAQMLLEHLNRRHTARLQTGALPDALRERVEATTLARSVEYTLARSRLHQIEDTLDALVLLVVLFSGVLPWSHQRFGAWLGAAPWATAAWVLAVGLALSAVALPLRWIEQFRLEARFGFNTATQRTWWLDRLKGLLLVIVLGMPLLALVFQIVARAGPIWWLWAWLTWVGFELLVMLVAPVVILPWFNRFTPLPEGSLRERLMRLAARTGFRARNIQVMDGSRRSRHSNAFFTGFGRFRKIVLFDTLIEQLDETELEAVLAHEIAHYQRGHLVKMVSVSVLLSGAGFYAAACLARQDWFAPAFGFAPGETPPALLVCALLAGVIGFWFAPLHRLWLRRCEYEADAFAAHVLETAQPLVSALRKLTSNNLGNLSPHPLYGVFYHSHPTLLEREAAVTQIK